MKLTGRPDKFPIRILLSSLLCWLICSRIAFAAPVLHFERPQLGLELAYEVEEEEHKSALSDSRNLSHEFKERMTLQTRGWIYHPALCKLTLRFEPEWTQATETQDEQTEQKYDDYSPAYFMDATFLESKPYNLYLFGQRNQTTINSAFAHRNETETDSYGGSLRYKSPRLPMDLSYTHLESEQTGFYISTEKSDDWRLYVAHYAEQSTTRLSSVYTDKERNIQGFTTHSSTSDSEIRNYYDFGTEKTVQLESDITYRRTESDLYETSNWRFNELLDWEHSPTLKTAYLANYNRIESNGFDSQSTSVDAQLTHLLYENLTTNLGVQAEANEYGEDTEAIYGARLNMRYLRDIPGGTLTAQVGQSYEATFRDYEQQFAQVIDEQQVLSDSLVTLLNQENVVLDSIEVTDLTGAIVYVSGVDYTLTPIDTFVRIRRSPFGAIIDGQTVLISYRYERSPDYDDGLYDQSYSLALYLWSIFSVNYRYQHARQRILSGVAPDHPIDDTTESGAVRLDFGWSDTRLSYTDSQKSSGISTLRWRAEETLRFHPSRRLFFSLTGYYGRTRFKDQDETEENFGGRVGLDWVPTYWCQFSLNGFQDNVTGTTQETINTGATAELEMVYRIWGLKISGEFANEEQRLEANERTRSILRLEITRRLW